MKMRTMALGATLAAALATGASAETLRFGHYANTSDTPHKAAEMFAWIVDNMTGGDLTVEIYPAGELGNSANSLQGARLGTIDITVTGNPYFTSFAPQVNVLDLPFLFESPEHAYRVLDGEVGEELMTSINEVGLQGLAFWEIGFRNLTNNERPINTPADLEGLKLRTTPNPAHIEAFTILGANPAPMPFAELYSALQTGTVDGQENPTTHIYHSNFHEVQKYLSITEHAYTAAPLVMNQAKFDGLPEDQQEALKVAGKIAAAYERELNRVLETSSLEAMKAAGVEIVMEPDVAAFRELVAEKTRAMYAEKFGDDLLVKIDALAPSAQ
ncbi:TRAP transporter substrate-binding protein [Acuticoccus sp. I52.16.1]|uniref:TRAP transporter substrate-binding protein n=1 Tax=Acuticoccus sp. I52.16.1 TaxID=2928472 RepID=UPI001FCFDAF7|nr:TRAP transporter substrate-binding protein [Acuticoccus sp. I52.16.1]UOM33952.1 TRAP transporter substrate-binding protein [Acuticoccus sp. I52.16.1]